MRQLTKLDITQPGSWGLNREERSALLDPRYATVADNLIIDRQGLLAARKGKLDSTGTAITGSKAMETLFEYRKSDGTTANIVAWDGGIANSIDNPEGNDISGALTDTNGTWWMQNFNDKVLAFQSGQKFAVYTGTGSFATVVESGGTAPSSGIAGCVFGRVWARDDTDGGNLKYSGLLDETDWNGTGAGSIDFNNIWTNGQDEITAITGYNGQLVVFGKRHIVFISDGTGAELGINPANAFVSDVIQGTGCLDQQTLQPVGETDLLFVSDYGLQSLSRVIQERSNPTLTISKNVHTELLEAIRAETAGQIRSCYSPDEGFYLLSFPDSSKTYAFVVRKTFRDPDGDIVVPTFKWTFADTALLVKDNGNIYFGGAGEAFQYSGTTDNGSNIAIDYESSWLDFGEEVGNRLKILKRIGFILFSSSGENLTVKYYVDFSNTSKSYTKGLEALGSGSEWGVAEFGIDEFGGGSVSNRISSAPARATGQYFKIGFSTTLSTTWSLQQVELVAKIGRLA